MKRSFSTFLVFLSALGAAGLALAAQVAVFTRPIDGMYDGPWMVEIATRGDVESSVLDSDGRLVAGPFASKVFAVHDVKTWSAEDPVCYRLVTEGGGGRTETVFGFAERVIRGNRLFVNGRPVRLKLAPRSVHGNTIVALDYSMEYAWTNGLYRLPLTQLARLEVMRPLGTEGATRHAFQNWSVKATNNFERIVVTNRNAFRDASDVDLRWTLLVDGKEKDNGQIDLLSLKPGRESSFDMPQEVIAARFASGTVSVRFAFVRDGETIADDQIDLVASRDCEALVPPEGWFASLMPSFFKGRVAYGEAKSMAGGVVRCFTTGGIGFNFDEDRLGAITLSKRGLFSDRLLIGSILPCREGDSPEFFMDVIRPPSAVEAHQGALSFTSLSEGDDIHWAARWTVYPNGIVACQAKLRAPHAQGRERLGLALSLGEDKPKSFWGWWGSLPEPGADVKVDWFGRGPWSTKPDAMEGAFLGQWRADASKPLGLEEVRGIRVGELTVRTLGAPMTVRLGACGALLELFGDPADDGIAELAFTLSVNDGNLTARSPMGEADLPLLPTVDTNSKGSEAK